MTKGACAGIFVIVLATIIAVGLVPEKASFNDRVTREVYERIVKGMSMEEVRSMLGSATSDEVATRTGDNYYANSSRKRYVGEEATIVLHVQKGVVLGKQWIDNPIPIAAMPGGRAIPPPPPPSLPPPPPPPPPVE